MRGTFQEHISITWNRHLLTSSFPRKRGPRGRQHVACPWVPAFAGTTKKKLVHLQGTCCNSRARKRGPRGQRHVACPGSPLSRYGMHTSWCDRLTRIPDVRGG